MNTACPCVRAWFRRRFCEAARRLAGGNRGGAWTGLIKLPTKKKVTSVTNHMRPTRRDRGAKAFTTGSATTGATASYCDFVITASVRAPAPRARSIR